MYSLPALLALFLTTTIASNCFAVNLNTPTPLSHEATTRLASLSPAQRDQYLAARKQALQDPTVQSTRELARMALHNAMISADPGIEAILANMNAMVPESLMESTDSTMEKKIGTHFNQWLQNIPASARATLTTKEKEQLKAAHTKAIENPKVQSANKTAQITFVNALLNADPLIGPTLQKMGIPLPNGMSGLGNEGKILGGNFQLWGDDILGPNIEKLSTQEKLQLQNTQAKAATDPNVVAALQARNKATTALDKGTAEANFKKATFDAMIAIDPSIRPLLEKISAKKRLKAVD